MTKNLESRIDKLLERFEDEAKAGKSPSVEDYLGLVPQTARTKLRTQLVAIESHHRAKGELAAVNLAIEHPSSEELAAYLNEELDPDRQMEVEEHLESCKQCLAVLPDLEMKLDSLAAAKPLGLSEHLQGKQDPDSTIPPVADTGQGSKEDLAVGSHRNQDVAATILPSPDSSVPFSEIRSNNQHIVPHEILQQIDDQTIFPSEASGSGFASLVSFGDYEILNEIARGGMGVVYRARQKSLNRIVALKMILSGQFAGNEEVHRFYAEASAAAKLDHPGIVPIYEFGAHENNHFFSMGFVEGKSLQQRLNDDGPMAPIVAAKMMVEIAEAVGEAHQNEVLHRDLKPANILLDQNQRPKITDFGLAKSSAEDSGLTATGQILGTPSYMPPEQAAGHVDEVSAPSDVYSLGGIFYAMLTGRPPFQAASLIETLTQVLDAQPVSPSTLVPSVPRDAETICLKCLEKEQSRRYESAKHLKEDLERYIKNEPILARPIGVGEKVQRWLHRQRKTLVATLAAAILSIALVAVVVIGWLAYQESLIGSVKFNSTEDSGYVVAEVFDEADELVARQTLPTQEAIDLKNGDYRVRVSGSRVLSKDLQLSVRPKEKSDLTLSLEESKLWPTINFTREMTGEFRSGVVEKVDMGDKSDLLIMDRAGVTLIDGGTGREVWRTELVDNEKIDATNFRWVWRSGTLTQPSVLDDRPKVTYRAEDLDEDGVRDILIAGTEQAWLLALSGSDGAILWSSNFSFDKSKPQTVPRESTIVHVPQSVGDQDGDNVTDFLIAVYQQWQKPSRKIELVSGRTGKAVWSKELADSLFETKEPVNDDDYELVFFISQGYGRSNNQRNRSGIKERIPSSFQPLSKFERELVFVAGSNLVRLEPSDGNLKVSDLGFTPQKNPAIDDVDNDGGLDAVFLATDSSTEVIVWSLESEKVVWQKELNSEWGKNRDIRYSSMEWPIVRDFDGDGKAEIVVSDRNNDMPCLTMLDSFGEVIWQRSLPDATDQLDRFLAGPDINGDGCGDIFVVSIAGDPLSGMAAPIGKIYIDSISGKTGDRIWWNNYAVEPGRQKHARNDFFFPHTLRWWNVGTDGLPELLIGIQSDVFTVSSSTGKVTSIGRQIDSMLFDDFDGDGIDDLLATKNGKLDSSRGSAGVNWRQRSYSRVSGFNTRFGANDIDGDGVSDIVRGESLVSGATGENIWKEGDSRIPGVILDRDLDGDGVNDILAAPYWKPGRVTQNLFLQLVSGKTGRSVFDWKDELHGNPSNSDEVVSEEVGRADEIHWVNSTNEQELKSDLFTIVGSNDTWLTRLSVEKKSIEWRARLFSGVKFYDSFPYEPLLIDCNQDEVLDCIVPAWLDESNSPVLTAFNGKDGTVLWTANIDARRDLITLSEISNLTDALIRSFTRLNFAAEPDSRIVFLDLKKLDDKTLVPVIKIIDTNTGSVVKSASTRPIKLSRFTGRDEDRLLPKQVQIARPVVLKRGKETLIAVTVLTDEKQLSGWDDKKLEPFEDGLLEEVFVFDRDLNVISQFGLPSHRWHRQRIFGFDTNADGNDELILIDDEELVAIEPVSNKVVWTWKSDSHSKLNGLRFVRNLPSQDGYPHVGVFRYWNKVWGIDFESGKERWSANFGNANGWTFDGLLYSDGDQRPPRILYDNENEMACVTPRIDSRFESMQQRNEVGKIAARNSPATDPRFKRSLPWAQTEIERRYMSNPSIDLIYGPSVDTVNQSISLRYGFWKAIPLFFTIIFCPWFVTRFVRKFQFGLWELLGLVGYIAVVLMFVMSQVSILPEQLKLNEGNSERCLFLLPVFALTLGMASLIVNRRRGQIIGWISMSVIGSGIIGLIFFHDSRKLTGEHSYTFDNWWFAGIWILYIIGVMLLFVYVAVIILRISQRSTRFVTNLFHKEPETV